MPDLPPAWQRPIPESPEARRAWLQNVAAACPGEMLLSVCNLVGGFLKVIVVKANALPGPVVGCNTCGTDGNGYHWPSCGKLPVYPDEQQQPYRFPQGYKVEK